MGGAGIKRTDGPRPGRFRLGFIRELRSTAQTLFAHDYPPGDMIRTWLYADRQPRSGFVPRRRTDDGNGLSIKRR